VTQRDLFDGDTFDGELDGTRLRTLLMRVHRLMHDGEWRTLRRIMMACGGSEASVSARLRDLRKARWGAHTVERRRHPDADGLWLYRVSH
jgi:uncharacterized protein (DUF2132 family)